MAEFKETALPLPEPHRRLPAVSVTLVVDDRHVSS